MKKDVLINKQDEIFILNYKKTRKQFDGLFYVTNIYGNSKYNKVKLTLDNIIVNGDEETVNIIPYIQHENKKELFVYYSSNLCDFLILNKNEKNVPEYFTILKLNDILYLNYKDKNEIKNY